MCTAVYIASDRPLKLIPWEEGRPSFYVAVVSEEPDIQVRKQFTYSHICYAGSYEGCGCGFHNIEDPEIRDLLAEEERLKSEEDRDALAHYLTECLKSGQAIALFVCWEGEQGEPPEVRETIVPDDVRSALFWEEEKRKYCTVVDGDR